MYVLIFCFIFLNWCRLINVGNGGGEKDEPLFINVEHFPDTQIFTPGTPYRARSVLGIMLQLRQSMACPPVWSIIHSLKLVDYLSIQTDNHGLFSTFSHKYVRMFSCK